MELYIQPRSTHQTIKKWRYNFNRLGSQSLSAFLITLRTTFSICRWHTPIVSLDVWKKKWRKTMLIVCSRSGLRPSSGHLGFLWHSNHRLYRSASEHEDAGEGISMSTSRGFRWVRCGSAEKLLCVRFWLYGKVSLQHNQTTSKDISSLYDMWKYPDSHSTVFYRNTEILNANPTANDGFVVLLDEDYCT